MLFQVDLLLVYDVRAVGVALVAADNYLTAFKLQYSIDHISNLAYVMDGNYERVRAIFILHQFRPATTLSHQ